MIKHKVGRIFASYSKEEIKLLGLYLRHPLFNSRKIYLKVFDGLNMESIDADFKLPEFMRRLFPQKTDGNHRKILTGFSKVLLDFGQIITFMENEEAKGVSLLRFLNKRGLDKDFLQKKELRKQFLYKKEFKTSRVCKAILDLERENLIYLGRISEDHKHNLFSESVRILEQYHMILSLDTACKIEEYEKMNGGIQIENRPEVVGNEKELAERCFRMQGNKVVQIYYRIYTMLSNTGGKDDVRNHYLRAKELVREWSERYDDEDRLELQDLFAFLINFCSRGLRKKSEHSTEGDFLISEVIDIYELQLKSGLQYEDGQISPENLQNMVYLYIRRGKFHQAHEFLDNHVGKLTHNIRGVSFLICRAYIFFHEKQFEKTRKLLFDANLEKIEIVNLKHYLELYSLYLRTLYELEKFDEINHLTTFFITRISNNPYIPADKSRLYLDFSRNMNRLCSVRLMPQYSDQRKKGKDGFLSHIGVASSVPLVLDWLRKKMEAL